MKKAQLTKGLIIAFAVLLFFGGVAYLLTMPILSDAILCDPDRIELIYHQDDDESVRELGYFDGRSLLRTIGEIWCFEHAMVTPDLMENHMERAKNLDQIRLVYDEVQKTDRSKRLWCDCGGHLASPHSQTVDYDAVTVVMEEKYISFRFLLNDELVDYWIVPDGGEHAVRNVFSDFCD